MSYDLLRRNDALALNPSTLNGRTADISSTVRGSAFYFAISAIMATTAFTVLGLSYLKPRRDRIFFYITAALNATAAIAYFTMGSNLGFAPIGVEFVRSSPKVAGLYRQVFYARYIDWVVTTPLLLMDLMLTAGLPWPTILWTIFLDEVMIITGLIGALVQSRYKFGFFVIGCLAMFGVFYELAINGRRHARALGNDVSKCYTTCGVLTLFLWTLYPIAWGVSEGGNLIAPDSEAVFYGILDVIAKPVFSAALIFSHWNIDPSRLGLQIRDFTVESNNRSGHNEKLRSEKVQPSNLDTNTDTNAHSTGIALNNISQVNNTSNTGHASHTHGFAPVHEGTTTESGLHASTARHGGMEV